MFVFLHKDDTSISPSGGPSSSSTNNTHTRFLITWAAAFQWLYYIGSVPSNIYLQLLLMLCCSAQRGRINGRVCVCDHLCCEPPCGRHKSCTDANRAARLDHHHQAACVAVSSNRIPRSISPARPICSSASLAWSPSLRSWNPRISKVAAEDIRLETGLTALYVRHSQVSLGNNYLGYVVCKDTYKLFELVF